MKEQTKIITEHCKETINFEYIMKVSQKDCNYMTIQELQLQYFQKQLINDL